MIGFKKKQNHTSGEKSEKQTRTIAGRIGSTLFGLIFLCSGLLFMGLVLSDTVSNVRARFWQKTPCVIDSSAVRTVSDGYEFTVAYTYVFEETSYQSRQIQPGKTEVTEKKVHRADALADQYAPEIRSICYVNPSSPQNAILKHGNLWSGLFVLIPLIFVAIGGGTIYSAWAEPKEKAPKTETLYAKTQQKEVGNWFVAVFFMIFFIAGFAFGYALFFPAIFSSLTSGNWIETPCYVKSSRMQTHEDSDGDTYSVDILYEYQFDGRTFRSNRYNFMGGSSSGRASKAEAVRQYPPGKQAVCYVNPDNPSKSVLNRKLGAEAFLALIPIIFMIVGIGGVFFSLRGSPKSGQHAASLSGNSLPIANREQAETEPLILKSNTSRIGSIIGVIFICAFWNGIVSVFAYQAFQSWRSGHPEYFLTLFLIPFVIIGLVLFGGIFYAILAAFNPRPVITLFKQTIRLGEQASIRWAIAGNVSKIRQLKISFIGEESASYRRGTDILTDRHVFHEKVLANSMNPQSVKKGDAVLSIPAESMHSFKSDNNAITWKILLHCDIPWWPDVKEEVEITVHPIFIEDF